MAANEFGRELRRLLGDRSQAWLAEKTGLTQASISRLLSGKQTPTHETVEAIADALRVDVVYLKEAAGLRVIIPSSERDSRIEYIAQRLAALPPAAREEAIDALGTQLDTIYKVLGMAPPPPTSTPEAKRSASEQERTLDDAITSVSVSLTEIEAKVRATQESGE